MVHRHHITILLLSLLIGFAACTKHADGTTGPAGPAGSAGANGNAIPPSPITGYVDLYNEYAHPDSSFAGALIGTLEGDSLVTATTDSTGNFALPALPPGNYNIHITKPGFDSLEVFVQHSGGNEAKFIGAIHLAQHVTANITATSTSLAKDVFGNNMVMVNVSFNGAPSTVQQTRNFYFYFSASKELTSTAYETYSQGPNEATTTNQYQLQYEIDNISAAGFIHSPGDTEYVKIIVAPDNPPTTWFNYTTYQTVNYPYLGDSTVTYFIWPN